MTRRISEEEIKGLEPLAVGYKMFEPDWSCRLYNYADRGEIEGSIHECDGELDLCGNGLHFCKNPINCLDYYPIVQWSKFAKVEAYKEIREDDKKTAARILKITKVLSFDEFIDEIKTVSSDGVSGSYGVRSSYGVSSSDGVSGSYGVSDSDGVSSSYGVRECLGIYCSAFCFGISGRYKIFNKQVKKERAQKVIRDLCELWTPTYYNIQNLSKKAFSGNIWDYMSDELKDYIKSLPEYNAKIFKKITEIEL